MIALRFGPEDLARVRFAFSPLVEAALSVRVLSDPGRHALHLPWVRRAERRLRGIDLGLLRALVPAPAGYIPDFLAPPPEAPLTDFEAALDALRRTDPDLVRREARKVARIRPGTAGVLERLGRRPEEGLAELADRLTEYWEAALAVHWSKILGVLEGEVIYRARRLAVEGAEGLFDGLHRDVHVCDSEVRIRKPRDERLELGGRGFLLVPSAFAWPDVWVVTDRPWQPSIWYPARGVGWLWSASPPAPDRGLERLVGPARARVLQALRSPSTTTQVARRLGVSPSSVSQHLGRLRETGMLARTRVGRRVFYSLTGEGLRLLELFGAVDQS